MSTKQVYKRPCKIVSLKEKLAILMQFESGSSRSEIEEIFKCSKSTICRILASKESILQKAKNCNADKLENFTDNAYKQLYIALTKWAQEMNKNKSVITAHMARKKAEELSRNRGQELSPSNAWLYKWREKENVQFAKKPKESQHNLSPSVKPQMDTEKQSDIINKETSRTAMLNDNDTTISITDNHQEVVTQDRLRIKDTQMYVNKYRSKREYISRLLPTGLICKRKKKKTFLTLQQKLELLQRLRNGERRPDLSIEYNLSQSAMSQIVNEEEKILKVAAKGQNLQRKRIRGGIFRDGEAELNNWVLQKMAKGESLTNTQIKTRAKEIAETLNIDFKASTGWLAKWKARMNMEFNENRILQRKFSKYIATDVDTNSDVETEEPPDIFYDHFECQEIKPEIEDYNNSDDGSRSHEELNCEIKSEYVTPQQFYLQTIENDPIAQHDKIDWEKKDKLVEDMKKEINEPEPAITNTARTSKEIIKKEEDVSQENEINKTIIRPLAKESLHSQIHNWLYHYHIDPLAAKELLDILKSHLDEDINANNANHIL